MESVFEKNNTKERNFDLLWGPKWPYNWATEAHFPHTSKTTCNECVKQYGCETIANVWRQWPVTGILTYCWSQHGPKIEPMRPIIHKPPEVATMSMWKKILMWNQWKRFEKMTKDRSFGPILGSFEAHIVYISESGSSKHIKQDWCESRGIFLPK